MILMDYLKSNAFIITMTAPLPRRRFVVSWKRVCACIREHNNIIIKCKDRWLSTLESGTTLRFLQLLGCQYNFLT